MLKHTLKVTVLSIAFLFTQFTSSAQDKPTFLTKSGEEVTEIDCGTMNGLKVKFPIPPEAFKYDEIIFYIEFTTGKREEDEFGFIIIKRKKEFTFKYEENKTATFWVTNPDDEYEYGEFTRYRTHFVSKKFPCCGRSKEQTITLKAMLTGYIETGSEQAWNDYNSSWETVYKYDGGTDLITSDLLIIKQTEKNIKTYKRNKLLGVYKD